MIASALIGYIAGSGFFLTALTLYIAYQAIKACIIGLAYLGIKYREIRPYNAARDHRNARIFYTTYFSLMFLIFLAMWLNRTVP